MQQQQLQAVAGNSTKPAASAACDDAATIAVTVKVLTKPQPTVSSLLQLSGCTFVKRRIRITPCSFHRLLP
jgi:hypothetical protein